MLGLVEVAGPLMELAGKFLSVFREMRVFEAEEKKRYENVLEEIILLLELALRNLTETGKFVQQIWAPPTLRAIAARINFDQIPHLSADEREMLLEVADHIQSLESKYAGMLGPIYDFDRQQAILELRPILDALGIFKAIFIAIKSNQPDISPKANDELLDEALLR